MPETKIISNDAAHFVDQTIGFIVTDTKVTGNYVDVVATVGASRAETIWNSYLRDTSRFIRKYGGGASPDWSPSPSPSCDAQDFPATGVSDETINLAGGGRLAEAAFYLAVEQFASELLRLRIGNVGADPASAIAEGVVSKAMALVEMSAERIAAFEKYCQTEAGIIGNHYQEIVSFAAKTSSQTESMAKGFWLANPTDGMAGIDIENPGDDSADLEFIKMGAMGIGQQIIGANILQRKLGFSGARNAELASYYSAAGKAMADQGTDAVAKFAQFAVEERPAQAMSYLGL